MKKKLNRAVMKDRIAHVAYDKQFKQQWQGVLDRREQHQEAMPDCRCRQCERSRALSS